MAKSSAEIERELEAKRQKLHVRAAELREKVLHDVHRTRRQTQEELQSYVQKAEGTVADHPWLSVAGGFGGGVALGLTAPTPGGGGHKSSSGRSSSGGGGEGLLSRGLNTVLAATAGPAVEEVRGRLQDSLGEIKTSLQDAASEVVHSLTSRKGTSSTDGSRPPEPGLVN